MVGELVDETRQTEAETADLDQYCLQAVAEDTADESAHAVVDQVPAEVVLGQVGDQVAADLL